MDDAHPVVFGGGEAVQPGPWAAEMKTPGQRIWRVQVGAAGES